VIRRLLPPNHPWAEKTTLEAGLPSESGEKNTLATEFKYLEIPTEQYIFTFVALPIQNMHRLVENLQLDTCGDIWNLAM
jgi:hypothetical protein